MGQLVSIKSGECFFYLTVIQRAGRDTHGNATYLCRCVCGAETIVAGSALRKGFNKSCGCKNTSACRITHGMSKTPVYKRWTSMFARCYNPKHPSYKNYGGRGITVCKRWREFNNFLTDMGPPPPGLTLERINNDKGYEPANCKWATRKEQVANRRSPAPYRKRQKRTG